MIRSEGAAGAPARDPVEVAGAVLARARSIRKAGPYRLLVLESFALVSTSGHRQAVSLRPAPGQMHLPGMLVECSRALRDGRDYPAGTTFLAWTRVKQKAGCAPHLYCDWRDEVIVVPAAAVAEVMSKLRDG